ncbi:MAG: helix-turn-helix domain-containing protein [Lentisphaeraceae bacterium]|nr:helix-turn-helix domain-containing protein [Lentisphaeraceae bacterium]
MSRISLETREETEELYQLGLIEQKDYEQIMKLTARDIQIPAPVNYSGEDIVKIRKDMHCSQKVFADILGVTADTISKWERNYRQPEKIACRFLKVLEQQGMKAIH